MSCDRAYPVSEFQHLPKEYTRGTLFSYYLLSICDKFTCKGCMQTIYYKEIKYLASKPDSSKIACMEFIWQVSCTNLQRLTE